MENENQRIRADELLVVQGLAESRSQARNFILESRVSSSGIPITKPGKLLAIDTPLHIENPLKYVSRAGEKLEAFVTHYNIDSYEQICLDIGASTGGFTDFLLQNGASHVTCLDVGHSQLHPKLLNNPKIVNIEKTNARTVSPEQLPHNQYDIVVIDVSFISLTKILNNIWQFLKPQGSLIALIKPQFEATKKEILSGKGIIRDSLVHERIVKDIQSFALNTLKGAALIGLIPCPIKGSDGNQEFLMGIYLR